MPAVTLAPAGSSPDWAAGIPRPLVAPLIDELAKAIIELCRQPSSRRGRWNTGEAGAGRKN